MGPELFDGKRWSELTYQRQQEIRLAKAKEYKWIYGLECDACGKFICYCQDNDLNGSYFYCQDCVPFKEGEPKLNAV